METTESSQDRDGIRRCEYSPIRTGVRVSSREIGRRSGSTENACSGRIQSLLFLRARKNQVRILSFVFFQALRTHNLPLRIVLCPWRKQSLRHGGALAAFELENYLSCHAALLKLLGGEILF